MSKKLKTTLKVINRKIQEIENYPFSTQEDEYSYMEQVG